MAPTGTSPSKSKELLVGGVLHCCEAGTLGLPFEVWKTHMGTYRTETTFGSLKSIFSKGGIRAFYRGWEPKMIESFLKGGILLFSKEHIMNFCSNMGMGEVSSGVIGGFGGGVAQVSVLGPCTFLVTAAVTGGDKSVSVMQKASQTYAANGIKGFYRGGVALMLRQGSNWASRQAVTDYIRILLKRTHSNPENAKLSIGEEALAGSIGGAISTWNQPFEVMRIEAQAAAARGLPPRNIVQTCRDIVKESGLGGLFRGIVPRIGLCITQTLFMVTLPHVLKEKGIL